MTNEKERREEVLFWDEGSIKQAARKYEVATNEGRQVMSGEQQSQILLGKKQS